MILEDVLVKIRFKKIAVGLFAVAALTLGLPAGPAMAINSVSCGNRTDFLTLHAKFAGHLYAGHCYANAGVTAVNVKDVHEVSSGNNKATVNFERAGRYYTVTLEKWHRYSFGGDVRVYEVRIW